MKYKNQVLILIALLLSAGCSDESLDELNQELSTGGDQPVNNNNATNTDTQLRALLTAQNITGNPTAGIDLPSINDPVSQLGMKLFFSKSLGGEMDTACVSCHHPSLGGDDDLALSVGVHAIDEDLIGVGRRAISGDFSVPRNAPTTFNSALYRAGLFWDSRVQRLDSGIRTPDTAVGMADAEAGNSLLSAQARFPVTSIEEMRTENFETNGDGDTVRAHLAARIGGVDGLFNASGELNPNNWLIEFQTAFGSSESAETLVTYNNIAQALAGYQASQVFIDSPWKAYVEGDNSALSASAKRGAVLFFTPKENGGGDCSRCHSGDLFSDEDHHIVAFPQIGPGKGDGPNSTDDFGRARETGNSNDRYKFRTPSLLNVVNTAPYGHSGAYETLEQVVRHYDRPSRALDFFEGNWCRNITDDLNTTSCNVLFPDAETNTRLAQNAHDNQARSESLNGINLNNREVDDIVAFLETLTDPCSQDRNCLDPWIPEISGGPDGNQLNAHDRFGNSM